MSKISKNNKKHLVQRDKATELSCNAQMAVVFVRLAPIIGMRAPVPVCLLRLSAVAIHRTRSLERSDGRCRVRSVSCCLLPCGARLVARGTEIIKGGRGLVACVAELLSSYGQRFL